jgi:SPP1 gp7 family putative phage head morphogenesis protein
VAAPALQLRSILRGYRLAGVGPRRRRARKRLPRQLQPDAVRLSYFAALRSLLDRARERVVRDVLPYLPAMVAAAAQERGDAARLDAPLPNGKRLNTLIEGVAEQFAREIPNRQLEELAAEMGRRTSAFQRQQLERQLRAALGVEVPVPPAREGVLIDQFVEENVALIRTIPDRYFEDVEKRVAAGVRAGTRATEIAAELEERYEVTKSQAQRIANDQIGKLYGEINESRQKSLGVDAYVWRSSNDNRVRPEHQAREGRRYLWSEPPADGHPGEPINCRCYAEPDLSAILEEASR